jgi:hypothetical protein
MENDYLLVSLGEQTAFGFPAPHADQINAYVRNHPDSFQVADIFTLPSGATIYLYRCLRESL